MTEDKDRLHVLQVTDCHLLPDPDATLLGVRTAASLAAVLDAAVAERTPDAVLATGDLAQAGVQATYELFLATIDRYYDGPLLCVPGNHDHGATFERVLPTDVLQLGDWLLVGVDTHVDEVVGGTVGEDELARLSGVLDNGGAGSNVLVAGHHCPVALGSPWLDIHRIDNGGKLLTVIAAAGAKAYVFGHIHQEAQVHDPASVPLYGTPSTCFQFATDTPTFALDDAQPGYRWLHLGADGSLDTEVRRLDGYDLALDPHDRDRR